MKKKLFILFFLGLYLSSCTRDLITELTYESESIELSDRVLPSEAIQIANSYSDLLFPETRSSSSKGVPEIEVYGKKTLTRSGHVSGLDTMLYILNYPNQGFALVGADRRMQHQIYAISDHGTFNLNDTIYYPELKTLMGTLENTILSELESMTRSDVVHSTDNRVWKILERIEKPVKTKWGQGSPFNQYCFTTSGQQALAGCGPIAVSQIMAYHKYPIIHTNTRTGVNYVYPWDQMEHITDIASANRQPDLAQHVARFIEQVGSECLANYGVNATSTYLTNCITAFEKMGYKISPANGYKKIYYDIDQVREGLSTTGPVLMTGQSDNGGHAWVIEGYLKMQDVTPNVISTGIKELVKCNWGWNSRADGYYASGVFDTRQGGYVEGNSTSGNCNFYYGLEMVPKIYPGKPVVEPTLPKYLKLRENETHTLDVNWAISNKDAYEFQWSLTPHFEYSIHGGQVRFECKLPDVYCIDLKIVGKYNDYKSKTLTTQITIEEDESISANYGRIEVTANNNSDYPIYAYINYGYTQKDVYVRPKNTVVYGVYAGLKENTDMSVSIEVFDNRARWFYKDFKLPKVSQNYRDVLAFDIDNQGIEQMLYSSYDYPDYDYWWERGMSE